MKTKETNYADNATETLLNSVIETIRIKSKEMKKENRTSDYVFSELCVFHLEWIRDEIKARLK